MHCEHREPWSCAVDPPRRRRSCCRTLPAAAPLLRVLLPGLLLALARGAHALPPPGGQQQQETLLPLVVELEASMHSSVLTELHAAAATIAEGPRPPAAAPPVPDSSSSSSAAATTALLGAPGAGAGGIPDSSAAVVGQVFQLRVPLSMSANGSCNDLHLTGLGKQGLPSWLSWDGERCLLRGVALEQDKGVHHLSASSGGQQRTVFSLEVYPEERADAEPTLLALQADLGGGGGGGGGGAGGGGGLPPFTCTAEEPVTVLTVILDADLTKMAAEERVGLLAAMRRYARVPLEHMRAAPVVNNRLFDMSAFMAGPGNAKKVVENGALLSWKVGCSLDQSSIPDISSVQSPAKDGSMSAQLGYPVVGWHIVNKKPPTGPKRVRRQLYNTPTPVPSLLPPTTHPEPPVRVVPTPTSPAIAPATDSSATPVRGPLPLPVKPTIRLRDQMAGHTPALGPPQPTRVLGGGTTSSVPGGGVQPTATRPTFVEATAVPTPPSTTRKPKTASTKKPTKRPRVKSTTAKPAAPRSTTTTTTTTAAAVTPAAPVPDNQQPSISNAIDYVDAWVGTYFEVKIPPDTFFDREDGTADNLRLTLKRTPKEAVSEGSWIQFNSTIQLLYGLPDEAHQGKHEYFLLATDKGGRSIMDAFEVRVNRWPAADKPAAVFVARFHGDPKSLDVHRKILLAKKLSYALGDRNTSTVTLRSIKKGSIVVEWTNNSLPQSPCPKEQITALSNRISDPTGKPKPAFAKAMEPEFKAINISVRGTNRCQSYTFVPPGEVPVVPAVPPTPTTIPVHDPRTDDVYLHTVIPAVVVAALLLVAGVTAMVCYRKKRRGKMTVEEQATFIKKGVPIIFADELDDSKSPPSSSIPLILQEEKPPLPPPEYPNLGGHGPHSTLLNAQDHLLLEDYGVYQDDDPNAPPYQPPPPFTVPIEGKGSRPKNMTSYRSPPPYVPP